MIWASVLLAALAVGWPLVLIAMLAAIVHLRLGPRAVFQSLAVMVTIKFLNSLIYSFPPMFGLLAWLVLLLAAIRVAGSISRRAMPVLAPLWIFVLVVAALTPFASSNPAVSWFKLAAFFIGATTILTAAHALTSAEARLLRAWMPSVVLAVALVSVLSSPLPASRPLAVYLFQGVMNQSQALGAFLAPLAALVGCRWLLYRKALSKYEWGALALVTLLLVATNCRTAVIAVIMGIGGALFLGFIRDRRSRAQSSRALLVVTLLGVFLLGAVLASPSAREGVLDFVFKNSTETSVEDAFMASRGVGIASHWQSFVEHPLTGTGFGVYPQADMLRKPVTFMGIPISAPVEKGFLPTAVLEEVGIPGALALLVLLAAMIRQAYRHGDLPWLAVLLTSILVNVGETVFFSMGGLGPMFWLWMALALRGVTPLPGEPRRLSHG